MAEARRAGAGQWDLLWTVHGILSFVTVLLLGFGLDFEFPLVVMFLNLTGVLSSQRMRS